MTIRDPAPEAGDYPGDAPAVSQALELVFRPKKFNPNQANEHWTNGRLGSVAEAMETVSQLFKTHVNRQTAILMKGRNGLASINTLSTEVILVVFGYVLDSAKSASYHLVRSCLSNVCSLWSGMISNHPPFWATLTTYLPARLLKKSLILSKPQPLRIVYSHHLWSKAKEPRLLNAVWPHSHRWDTVDLRFTSFEAHGLWLRRLANVSVPMLRNFVLKIDWTPTPTDTVVNLFRGRAPTLQSIDLTGVKAAWNSPTFSDLVALVIRGNSGRLISVTQLLGILVACPALEKFTIDDEKLTGSQQDHASVLLPYLRHIKIAGCDIHVALELLFPLDISPTTRIFISCEIDTHILDDFTLTRLRGIINRLTPYPTNPETLHLTININPDDITITLSDPSCEPYWDKDVEDEANEGPRALRTITLSDGLLPAAFLNQLDLLMDPLSNLRVSLHVDDIGGRVQDRRLQKYLERRGDNIDQIQVGSAVWSNELVKYLGKFSKNEEGRLSWHCPNLTSLHFYGCDVLPTLLLEMLKHRYGVQKQLVFCPRTSLLMQPPPPPPPFADLQVHSQRLCKGTAASIVEVVGSGVFEHREDIQYGSMLVWESEEDEESDSDDLDLE